MLLCVDVVQIPYAVTWSHVRLSLSYQTGVLFPLLHTACTFVICNKILLTYLLTVCLSVCPAPRAYLATVFVLQHQLICIPFPFLPMLFNDDDVAT